MNSLRVQIESGARDVNAEAFLKVLSTTLDALKELDKHSSRFGGESIEWVIANVGKNSPVFAEISGGGLPQDNVVAAPQVIGDFVSGLAHLEENATCPQHFNERSLDLAADLMRSFSKGVTGIAFAANGTNASVSPRLAQNAKRAKRVLELDRGAFGPTYIEHGTIEGRLRQLESLAGSKDKVVIEDDLTGDKISCYFRGADTETKAREAWKQRVSVSGEITVDRKSGVPRQVDIESIVILRARADLPQMEDLYGLDITQGIDSVDYIRGLRDAE